MFARRSPGGSVRRAATRARLRAFGSIERWGLRLLSLVNFSESRRLNTKPNGSEGITGVDWCERE
jgi:hypothetical protein